MSTQVKLIYLFIYLFFARDTGLPRTLGLIEGGADRIMFVRFFCFVFFFWLPHRHWHGIEATSFLRSNGVWLRYFGSVCLLHGSWKNRIQFWCCHLYAFKLVGSEYMVPVNTITVMSSRLDSFDRNWQLPFLNLRKGENDRRKYFMFNLHERMLPDPGGIEPATSLSPVESASDWATGGSVGCAFDWW